MQAPTPPRNFEPLGQALIGSPGPDFRPEGKPEERRFNDAKYVGKVQSFTKPIRRVEPGVLLTGIERRRVFVGGVPPGLLLPPVVLSADFSPGWHAQGALFDRELVKVDSRLGGWPPEGEPLAGYIWSRQPIKAPEAWPVVTWALALGFTAEELSLFASAPGCLGVLREGAYAQTFSRVALLNPRDRLAVFRRAVGVLPGYSKADAGGPYAPELFGEALLEAATAADVPGLLALVAALAGEDAPAAAAGGAA
ncbi:MAG: hypothetical protein EPN53_16740 [Acidobacteria bacterium]|nr:MAG: hypothetical protein EPN53_16740 [Acidobacteriota bacterium]